MGDFNSHVQGYMFAGDTDTGGEILQNTAMTWDMMIANNPNEFTYSRGNMGAV